MPRAIRYECESLLDATHPEIVRGLTWAQTAAQAARSWDAPLTEGTLFFVRPVGGGLRTYWERKAGATLRVYTVEARRRVAWTRARPPA